MNKIAIIPARGGSKRIPRKNIKPFLGSPIIKYSIEAALQSGLFSEVMVSTDDEEIAAFAKKFGANVPFMRSSLNANDTATTAEVLMEVLTGYKNTGMIFDYGCCIYPTAPFVTAGKLSEAFRLLEEKDADMVIPVTKFSYPIQRCLKIDDHKLAFNWPEYALTRSQDLPVMYHDCGQFYFFRVDRFMHKPQLVTDNTIPIEIKEMESQDIDNEEDWKIAEMKYTMLNSKTINP